MKRPAKKAAALIMCAALAASAASCAASQTYPLTIDGEKIRAGIYILEQQSAVSDARSKLAEEQPDLDTSAEGFDYLKQTVEGKSFTDWVNDKTVEYCRKYVAVNRLFDSYGLSLTSDQISESDEYISQMWNEENVYAQYIYGTNTVGEYFEGIGVSEQSFRDVDLNGDKSTTLFDFLYGEGGEKAAAQDEINAALKEDYAAVNYFEFKLGDAARAQTYADRIAAEGFEAIYKEQYDAYQLTEYELELAAAEAKAEEEQSAAGEGTAEGTETAGSEESPETTLPVKPEDIELPETDALISIIKKDSTSPSEEFVKAVFEMSEGEIKVITVEDDDQTHIYIARRENILDKPEKTESAVNTLRTELKEDEYDEFLNTTGAGYSLTEDGSKSMYSIKKLLD